jgi:hypothetical protein
VLVVPEWAVVNGAAYMGVDIQRSVEFVVSPLCPRVVVSDSPIQGAGIVRWGTESGLQANDPRNEGRSDQIVDLANGQPMHQSAGFARFEEWDIVTAVPVQNVPLVLGKYRRVAPSGASR